MIMSYGNIIIIYACILVIFIHHHSLACLESINDLLSLFLQNRNYMYK